MPLFLASFLALSRRNTHYLPLMLAILRRLLTVAIFSATLATALQA